MSVPPFLQKAFEIFSDPVFADICGWGVNNDSIFIKNIDAFAKVVLPKYFKHSNYSSFTRQLHKYDFHKTVHNPRHGEFKHQHFVRDKPQLMKLIQRKVYVCKNPAAKNSDSSSNSGGNTDGETTETDSSKDGSSSSEKSAHADEEDDGEEDDDDDDDDFDFDFLGEDYEGDVQVEMDFDKFDEIESTVERGIIAFDNERISILEKRQRDLMEENESTKREIRDTLSQNCKMEKAIDCLMTNVVKNMQLPESERPPLEPPEDVDLDELCTFMKSKCKLASKKGGPTVSEEMKNYMKSMFSPPDFMKKAKVAPETTI